MGLEQGSKFIPDQNGIPEQRLGIIREAISGTLASGWQDPAREKLEAMIAQTLEDVHASCGENRWSTIGSYLDQAKLHVTQRGVDEPISILAPSELVNLGVPANSASIALRSALTNAVLMLGSNLTTITELREKQGKKGKYEKPAAPKRTLPRINASLR